MVLRWTWCRILYRAELTEAPEKLPEGTVGPGRERRVILFVLYDKRSPENGVSNSEGERHQLVDHGAIVDFKSPEGGTSSEVNTQAYDKKAVKSLEGPGAWPCTVFTDRQPEWNICFEP